MGYSVTVNEDHLEHGIMSLGYALQSKEKLIAERTKIQSELQAARQQYSYFDGQVKTLAPSYNRTKFNISNAEKNLKMTTDKLNAAKAHYEQSKSIYTNLKTNFRSLKTSYEKAFNEANKYKKVINSNTQKLADINAAISKKN